MDDGAGADVRVFRSKVDLWIAAVVAGAVGAGVWVALDAWRSGAEGGRPAAIVLLAILLLVFALIVPIRYLLTRDELIVRAGVLRWTVPLAAVRRVRRTRVPLSAPAWSLDRVQIDYVGRRTGSAIISPADREEFLALLETRAGLVRSGDQLVRP